MMYYNNVLNVIQYYRTIYHDVLLNASITVRRGATNFGSTNVVLSVVMLIYNRSLVVCNMFENRRGEQ